MKTAKIILLAVALIASGGYTALAADTAKDQPVLFSFDNDALLSGNTWDETLAAGGEWDGELGIQFRTEDDYENEADDGDAGLGFLETSWESGSLYGLQLGLGGLFTTEMWANDSFEDVFSDGGTFDPQAKWTQVYLKYTIPNSKSYLLLGRADEGMFGEPAAGDGDFYEGFGVTIKDIPRITIKAHVVKEWLNNASPSWDFNGIDDQWAEMEQASLEVGEDTAFGAGNAEEFGDFAYTLMTEIEAVPDMLTITPYIQYHSDVATVLGTGFELEHAVNDSLTLGLDGAYVWFKEDTPDKYWPDDEDFNQTLIHTYAEIKGFSFGAGYYSMSDDIPIFNGPPGSGQFEKDLKDIFLADEMDPMEEDLAKYGEQSGNDTYFVEVGYTHGPFWVEVIYGTVDNALTAQGNHDGEADELDIYFGVQITENLEAELAYADVSDDYTADGDDSYKMFGGGIVWKF